MSDPAAIADARARHPASETYIDFGRIANLPGDSYRLGRGGGLALVFNSLLTDYFRKTSYMKYLATDTLN
ncbi:MAG: hypothetical protein WA138_15770 [Parvibaculum sp.]